MTDKKKTHYGASIVGVIFIILGTLWVLGNLNIIDFQFSTWWPVILIGLGLMSLFGERRLNNTGAWIFIALGVIFLLTTNGIFSWGEIWKFWPVILIIIGISLLFSRKTSCETQKISAETGDFSANSIFADLKKKITDKNFKGGAFNAVFSDTDLDLSEAELHEDGAVMDFNVVFADVDMRIPASWAIETRTSGVFSGIKNKTANPVKTEGKRVILNLHVVFGDFELKN